MKFDLKSLIVPHFWKKFFLMLVSIFLMGFFLSFLVDVNWGVDPCTYQNVNVSTFLNSHFGSFWTLGNFQLALNLCAIIFVIIFNPRLIGFGTVANMTMIGYTIDFFRKVWLKYFPMQIYSDPNLVGYKILVFVAAITGFIFVASIYMNADMGLSPYDAIPKIISEKLKGISFTFIRIFYDSFVIIVGLIFCILNHNFEWTAIIGSLIMAVSLGPVITVVGKWMKKLLF